MQNENVVALYCRTAQKCDDAIALQEAMLWQYAKDNGYRNTAVYVDNGFPGLTLEGRPGMDEIRQGMENGSINTVIVKDFSRIARGVYPLWAFANEAESHGAELISLTDGHFSQVMRNFISHFIPTKA